MFGYVTPCKMELKIKDFEKFKAYYCGLCKAIKKNFGNLPRLVLNYDMTFLAVLLDSLSEDKSKVTKEFCAVHPTNKRLVLTENPPLEYAAFCNVLLSYYKLVDNSTDDNSKFSRLYSYILSIYLKKAPLKYKSSADYIENSLRQLSIIEKNPKGKTLDELSHPFADLTGFIVSTYYDENAKREILYWLGYNLGKWIYIIDAFDDLEKDMKLNKFNAINSAFNQHNLDFSALTKNVTDRIDFTLISCANTCLQYLNKLPIKKNFDLLQNILQLGLMEKIDMVFKKDLGGTNNERSI